MSKRKDQETLSKLIDWLKEAQAVPKVSQKPRKQPSTLNVLSRKLQSHIRSLEKGLRTAEQVDEIEGSIPPAYKEVLQTQLHFLGSLRAQYGSASGPARATVRREEQLRIIPQPITERLELDTTSSLNSVGSPSLSELLDLDATTPSAVVAATRDEIPRKKSPLDEPFSSLMGGVSVDESEQSPQAPLSPSDVRSFVTD